MRYFVGPLTDPGAGQIFVDLRDCVGFLAGAVTQAGIKWGIIPLPDRERYFVAGTRGRQAKPEYTQIFDNVNEAEQLYTKLGAHGFPKNDRVCAELLVNHTSPKAVETYNAEAGVWKDKHDKLIEALARGVAAVGGEFAPVEVKWTDGDSEVGIFPGYEIGIAPPNRVFNTDKIAIEDLSHVEIDGLIQDMVILCDAVSALEPGQNVKLNNAKFRAQNILDRLAKENGTT